MRKENGQRFIRIVEKESFFMGILNVDSYMFARVSEAVKKHPRFRHKHYKRRSLYTCMNFKKIDLVSIAMFVILVLLIIWFLSRVLGG